MIQMQSVLLVSDNSGAKKVRCIKVLGGSGCMSAVCGDVVVVSVISATPGTQVEKGKVHRALIIRTKTGVRRPDGSKISFDSNSVVLINKQNEPIGTRVFGSVPRELKYKGFTKIVSLAEEVI